MSKTPVVSGVFLFAYSFIIAVGVKLIRHVNVLDWRGFSWFWGLTGFLVSAQVLVDHRLGWRLSGDGRTCNDKEQKQIPFGDDNKKSRRKSDGDGNGKNNGRVW
ncbi:hypothetical protein [Tunturiibacter gelidoferens]|uniref:Uncharacterized protein n=2 Tax=Tunturiibacter gelidiferens TaxID=3069689 RepID=A0AAU7YYT3_9BACT|nr:hypothetical protein [Edaphobacter lichenicola]MBB5337954.1 hypothetical protein [Edaphobacter lichenicola]